MRDLPTRRTVAIAAAAALLAAAAAAVVGNRLISADSPTSKPKKGEAATARVPRGYVRFRDSSDRLSIAHPSNWIRLPPPNAQVKLLVARAGASLLLRVTSIPVEVTPRSIGPAKELTDEFMRASRPRPKLLRQPRQVTLGGLPGYLYLYTFRDSATRQRGAHARYFLFRGKTMFTLVFQALPATSFTNLAPLFDRIASTLRSEPTPTDSV